MPTIEELEAKIAELETALAAAVPPAYVPQAYPSMRYHASGATRIIASEADEDPEWSREPMPQETLTYPVYLHKDGARILVENAAARLALGDGWTA